MEARPLTWIATLGFIAALAPGCGSDGGGTAVDAAPDASSSGDAGSDADASDDAGQLPDSGPVVGQRVFLSVVRGIASLGGIDTADWACNQRAAAAGLDGEFVAWLSMQDASGKTVNAIDRVTGEGPWYRTDDALAFADRAQLAASPSVPIDRHGNGDRVTGPADTIFAWTGTAVGGVASGADCAEWTSADAGGRGLVGRPESTTGSWTEELNRSCGISAHIYCFEVDPDP